MTSARSRLLFLVALLACAAATAAKHDKSFDKYMTLPDFCRWNGGCSRQNDGSVKLTAFWDKMGKFTSKGYFGYGIFRVNMKLPSGYSGGLIPCIYLISGNNPKYTDPHDEIDLEFIGGNTPKDIILHTNLISGGQVYLQQYKFPFDPSAAFHTYTIVYSPDYVMWAVDDTPIRIHWKESGRPFPSQNVKFEGSIWDASAWSKLKPNWGNGPKEVMFRRFDLHYTCKASGQTGTPWCNSLRGKKAPWARKPSAAAIARCNEFRKNYLVKDYGWSRI
ncbi:unnamed protein product [Closterium sp. Yama58-4]|nr:unnamed protein product [Closterium sp. Yama58-4]